MRSFRLAVSIIVVALFSAACISEPSITSPTNAELAGTYTLRTVNGGGLPAVVQTETGSQPQIEILGDQITVVADGTWSAVQTYRTTSGTTVNTQTLSSSGTYAVSGAAMTFRDGAGAPVFSVSVSGNAFLLSDGVLTYLYTK